MIAQPTHIIALGASAGGMEELNLFFDHTPTDGVSYIVVQHLSASFKSNMRTLLSKHSKLTIHEVEDGMQVRSNQVYLIPNDMYLTIKENKLYLSNKENTSPPHLTIDRFFKSLAINSGTKAIGIILSGTGTDGTQGIKAIKEAGGMTIARDPENTDFGGMPSHAIATGLVDFILEPEFMPATLGDYIKYGHELLFDSPAEEKNISLILAYISEHLSFDFTGYKQTTILRRIKRRVAANHLSRLEQYVEFLKKEPFEAEALMQEFLISVTAFFRDPDAFKILEHEVIPAVIEGLPAGEELKAWVPGCATGEEAYSIAILIHEKLKEFSADRIVKIFATDIDTVALVHAGNGIYSAAIEKSVSAERLEKYFTREGAGYKVKPVIRKMLIFAPHDLVKNPPYCNMHLISCRNLLIYLDTPLQKKIFPMLLFGLKPKGFLFLGSSENPQPIIQHLKLVNKKWRIFRNRETKRVIHFESFSLPQMVDIADTKFPGQRKTLPEAESDPLAEAMSISLAEDMHYLALAIDVNNLVIKTYGNTTKYLLQKNFNVHLPELLPRTLAVAFNAASIKAKQEKEKVTIGGIDIASHEIDFRVMLSVSPLKLKNADTLLYLVVFREDRSHLNDPKWSGGLDEKIYLDQYTLMIEEELNDLKEKLHETYRQLDASNDNMQAYVEELLSANEEMQSTNEEMQSVNEELHTVNTDYQLKNKELSDLNDDLNNYFRSSLHGQLFVNMELLLVKYSPATVSLINLLPADIGRPLNHISTNIKFETIIEDIKTVLSNGTPLTREIQATNGLWYQVMTIAYIQQADLVQTGAIVTFNDITLLKKIQNELDGKNNSLMRINDDLNNFVNTTSHDLLAPLGNIEMSISVMNQVEMVNPRLKDFLTIINASIKKFRELITEISTIAKIENESLQKDPVDLEEIITNVEWSLDDKIRESQAVIKRQLEIPHIPFSKKNMRSVMYNLISNAIKFQSHLNPEIMIRTIKTGEHIILSVEDNGIGIKPGDVEKIWGMYQRLGHDIEGQGIGMFLTKKIINAAGGMIEVDSVPGKGSKFMVTFPLVSI